MDESENIDFAKLHKMKEWIYRTVWILSNNPERPKFLSPKKSKQ
jgi:hypothetical protein